MNIFEVLEFEHSLIRDVLTVAQTHFSAEPNNLPTSKAPGLADFCAKFISRCHHAKEFELYVTLLQKDRSSLFIGPIISFRADHGQLGQLTSSLAVAWALRAEGPSATGPSVAEYFNDYADRLRDHMTKENGFYQVACDVITPADQSTLKEAFNRLDDEILGTAGHDRYCRWAHEFAATRDY